MPLLEKAKNLIVFMAKNVKVSYKSENAGMPEISKLLGLFQKGGIDLSFYASFLILCFFSFLYFFHQFQCQFRPQYLNNNRMSTINGWTRGSYQCLCKQGFYSIRHPDGFNGTIMEVAYEEYLANASSFYVDSFLCLPCMEGCVSCTGPTPCLARYNWPFR